MASLGHNELTHWGRVTHICVSKLTIIGSDNGMLPEQPQAIIWTNAGILLIGPLGTNSSEILIEILISSFKKMCLKVSSAKRWPFCLSINVWSVYVPADVLAPNNAKPTAMEFLWLSMILYHFYGSKDIIQYRWQDLAKHWTSVPC